MTQKAVKQIEYTLTTHAIEHLRPSDYALNLCKRMADGKISADEAVADVLRNYDATRMEYHRP